VTTAHPFLGAPSMSTSDRSRIAAVVLAGVTACVSGVAVFVNGYGVRRFPDPTTYTTAKNLVAAIIIGAALVAAIARRPHERLAPPHRPRQWWGLLAVGVIGGGVPFVLFFEGLARASSTDAAFLHKTLVVWVAVLAVVFLHERVGAAHIAAVALLVWGQAVLGGGIAGLRPGAGEAMILVATVLWAVEAVVAKRLLGELSPLPLATARMGLGVIVLVAWALVRGELGTLTGLDASAWGWAALTGGLLAAYVVTWYGALARAQAVDVTAMLVFGALVTAALDAGVRGVALPDRLGLGLVAAGSIVAAGAAVGGRHPRMVAS
jgi:drug/metabolite transporter (DMT)-like permease